MKYKNSVITILVFLFSAVFFFAMNVSYAQDAAQVNEVKNTAQLTEKNEQSEQGKAKEIQEEKTEEAKIETKKKFVAIDASIAPQKKDIEANENVLPEEIPSLIFTYYEHVAIYDSKNSRGKVRAVTKKELKKAMTKKKKKRGPKPPPEQREIRLGGIVYAEKDDWTIWLNEKRVTPNAIPKEVIDLQVFDDYIEIKWYDDYTNKIFPIRLRSHQRFNIDTRIFLPG